MKKIDLWPPPDWFEVVITWQEIMTLGIHPDKYYEWCNTRSSKNRYHVHGYQSTQGFAFRFESKKDGMLFILKWK